MPFIFWFSLNPSQENICIFKSEFEIRGLKARLMPWIRRLLNLFKINRFVVDRDRCSLIIANRVSFMDRHIIFPLCKRGMKGDFRNKSLSSYFIKSPLAHNGTRGIQKEDGLANIRIKLTDQSVLVVLR